MNQLLAIIIFGLFVLGWMGTAFGILAFRRAKVLVAGYEAHVTNAAARIFELEETLERERQGRVKAIQLAGAGAADPLGR